MSDTDTPAPSWFTDSSFSSYWRHYSRCQSWAKAYASGVSSAHHMNMACYETWCRNMAQYHEQYALYLQHCGMLCSQGANQFKPPREAKKKRKKRTKKERKRRPSMLFSDIDNLPSDMEFVSDVSFELESRETQYQMELSEDMLEFFAHSAKHRQERDASRQASQLNDERENSEDHIDLGSVSAHRTQAATSEPPKEQPGLQRSNEMKELYGKGAAMIHAMETAMQLTYQRNCDKAQPQLWPQLPLNIQFE